MKNGMPYGEPVGQSLNKEEELNVLKDQAEDLEYTLNGIKKRIEKIEAKTKKE
ncbi:MAG: DUF5320 domain-containing protein [Deltaproteobacteria bacterium]|nr:DUF5320 domain-containing protein [Deltaproteobacteria bacterium]